MGMGFASLFVDIKDVPNFELRTPNVNFSWA
jgi:hypothetical protein